LTKIIVSSRLFIVILTLFLGTVLIFSGINNHNFGDGSISGQKIFEKINNSGSRSVTIKVPNDYTSIQKAIDNASAGDTILVSSGTYYEHIIIDKSINLIGEGEKNTKIDGNNTEYEHVININVDNVNISGFSIVNAGYSSGGIRFNEVSSIIIDNCSFADNEYGVYIFRSNNVKIVYNNFFDNNLGLTLGSSNSNLILKNSIFDNIYGIDASDSDLNIFSGNSIWNCTTGVAIRGDLNIVEKNYIWNNYEGINIAFSTINDVHYNNIFNNQGSGIYAESDTSVNATNNWWGDVSGPYNVIKNSNGKGNKVSNSVEFKPWLSAPFDTKIDFIQIRTESNGAGSIVNNITMTADETLNLWVAAYNHSFGYIGALNVIWNVTGDLDTVISISKTNIVFSPKNAPTSGTITIDDGQGHKSATGLISVKPGALDHIKINPDNITLFLNCSQKFTATGYDQDNNIVSISPFWRIDFNCTITQNGLLDVDNVCLGTWKIYVNQLDIVGYATITIKTNNSADTDMDGMLDWWEVENNLDPFVPSDAKLDPDFDGLTNLKEFFNLTDPFDDDSDDDSLGDGFELIFSRTNPTIWDSNGNGIGDGLEFLQTRGYTGGMKTLPDGWIGMTIKWSNYTIYVSTNSSVLNVEFNKDQKELNITVSGNKGTSGKCIISVPKGLINSTKYIKVSLDKKPLNFTMTQNDTYYFITVQYSHSTHSLIFDLEKSKVGPDNGQNSDEIDTPSSDNGEMLKTYIALSFVIAVIIIILLIVVLRLRKENGYTETPILEPDELSNMLEEKHSEGTITNKTYEDVKKLLEKYRKQ